MVVRVEEAEMDQMWSCNPRNSNAGCGTRWVTARVQFFDVLAPHEDAALKQLQQLLAPFSIEQFYTDTWGAYLQLLDPQHTVGRTNTQKIEWSVTLPRAAQALAASHSNQATSQKNDLLV